MDSRADNPPKLAPYPTLVGTAITRAVRQPADYAGQSTLHTCYGDDHPGGHNDVHLGQSAVDAWKPRCRTGR